MGDFRRLFRASIRPHFLRAAEIRASAAPRGRRRAALAEGLSVGLGLALLLLASRRLEDQAGLRLIAGFAAFATLIVIGAARQLDDAKTDRTLVRAAVEILPEDLGDLREPVYRPRAPDDFLPHRRMTELRLLDHGGHLEMRHGLKARWHDRAIRCA